MASQSRLRGLDVGATLARPSVGALSVGWISNDGVYLLAGIAILAFAWARLATGGVSLLVFQDASEQTYAWWQYSISELSAGRFPLWDPYTFAGRSNIGEGQEGVFYPPFLILALATGQWAESIAAIHLFAFLHAVLAFGGAYLLARIVGLRGLASTGCGIVYALGSFFSSRALGQLNIFEATAWVPLIVAGPFLVARTRRLRWSVLSGAALALSILAGHAQPGLHAALVVVFAVVFLCCVRVWPDRPVLGLVQALVTLVLTATIAVTLAAVQLLPTLEYQPLALRWVGGDEPILANARIPLEVVALNPSLDLAQLPSALIQGVQIQDGGIYVGLAALACAGLGAVLHPGWGRFFWIGLVLVGVVLSLGMATPLFALVFTLPLVDQLREPVRYLLLAHLGLGVLAGMGLDTLSKTRRFTPLAIGLLAVTSIQLGVAWSASLPSRAGYNGMSNREVQQYYSSAEADGLARFLASKPGLFRIDLADAPIPRNYGELLRIPTVGGYRATSPIAIQRFREQIGFRPPDRGPDMLGERFIVSSAALRGVNPVGQAGSLTIYENPRALPLAWLVADVNVVADDEQALAALQQSTFDPTRVAIIEEDASREVPGLTSIGGTANISEFRPENVRIMTQASGTALLVTSLAAYPGWVARIDGQRANLVTVNYAFQGIPVPAGQHTVELTYQPLSVIVGAGFSIAALLAYAVGIAWAIRR
jgi:hypothetical protein